MLSTTVSPVFGVEEEVVSVPLEESVPAIVILCTSPSKAALMTSSVPSAISSGIVK